MATVPDSNIHCLAVEGNFDDCQDIVKAAFMDKAFRQEVKLGAVNSINWARVLAQITYYFNAYYQVALSPSLWFPLSPCLASPRECVLLLHGHR